MATWVRSGTGTYPSATDLDVLGTMELDNGTAPADFDAGAVNSVRIQYDMEVVSGTFTAPEDHLVLRGVELNLNGVGTVMATVNGTDTAITTSNISTDETDSSPGLGFTGAQWETAELNPIDIAAVRAWSSYRKDKGADGVTIAVASSPNVTVTIDYTPAAPATGIVGPLVDGAMTDTLINGGLVS